MYVLSSMLSVLLLHIICPQSYNPVLWPQSYVLRFISSVLWPQTEALSTMSPVSSMSLIAISYADFLTKNMEFHGSVLLMITFLDCVSVLLTRFKGYESGSCLQDRSTISLSLFSFLILKGFQSHPKYISCPPKNTII